MNYDVPRQRPPVDDEMTPHKSNKDTRRWCRGKPGVPHQLVVRLDKNLAALRGADCRWTLRYIHGRRPVLNWNCRHERGCAVCGKVLEYTVPQQDCPAFQPAPGPVTDCVCNNCPHTLGGHEDGPIWASRCEHEGCGCRRFRWRGFT